MRRWLQSSSSDNGRTTKSLAATSKPPSDLEILWGGKKKDFLGKSAGKSLLCQCCRGHCKGQGRAARAQPQLPNPLPGTWILELQQATPPGSPHLGAHGSVVKILCYKKSVFKTLDFQTPAKEAGGSVLLPGRAIGSTQGTGEFRETFTAAGGAFLSLSSQKWHHLC